MIGREPSQTISQNGCIEVREQTDGQPRKPQIRDDLRLVNWQQLFDRFELEQDVFFERSDYRVSDADEWLKNHPIFKSSDLPIFLCHRPSSSDKLATCHATHCCHA